MKNIIATLLLFVSCSATAADWSITPLQGSKSVNGEHDVLRTALAAQQLVIWLEVIEQEPHATGSWFLSFTTHRPVTGFESVTAIAYNTDGPTYQWPLEVIGEASITGNEDGTTTIVVEILYDGIETIGLADHLLVAHSDDEIETALLWGDFDERFEQLKKGIASNEPGLDLTHLLLDEYDRNHSPLRELPEGAWPPVEEIEKAQTYLGLSDADLRAMAWFDIEMAVHDKEMEEFEAAQAKLEAEDQEAVRRGMQMKNEVESFEFPDHETCEPPGVPESFASVAEAEEKTNEIQAFGNCLQSNVRADIAVFGRLVEQAGGALDADTLKFDVDGAYFIHCECVEAFVAIRDEFYRRNATVFQRWATFEQSVAHLYESPGQ